MSNEVTIEPNTFKTISTGIKLEMPKNVEGQIRPRSGLAANFGVTVLNSSGTVDPGYKGEIKVILVNHGQGAYTVKPGEKTAQLVFARLSDIQVIQIDAKAAKAKQSDSDERRDEKGFGSSDPKPQI